MEVNACTTMKNGKKMKNGIKMRRKMKKNIGEKLGRERVIYRINKKNAREYRVKTIKRWEKWIFVQNVDHDLS